MPKKDIVVIGASAGGVPALQQIARDLPADLKASIFIVLHLSPFSDSLLPQILNSSGPLKAAHPKDGEKIKRGRIYIAPPDHHLIIEDDKVLVKKGPKENRFRPSIDALFRSAAYTYGPRVSGIVLSGMLDDGSSGLWSIKRLGGTAIVQDPKDASFPYMPQNALLHVKVDHIMPITEIGGLIETLSHQNTRKKPALPRNERKLMEMEVVIAARDNAFEMGIMNMGELTPFTCPECHGALISLKEGESVRFRCHTGHAFSPSSLLAGVTKSIEETLWAASRGLEETTMLLKQLGNKFKEIGKPGIAREFFAKAKAVAEKAQIITGDILKQELMSEDVFISKKSNGRR